MDEQRQESRATVAAPEPRIVLSLDHDPCVQYAMQQNDVPVVRLLRVENAGSSALEELVLRVELGSDLAEPYTLRIARLEPGAIWNATDVDLVLAPARLRRQEEREGTTLRVTALQGDEELAILEHPTSILAWNEWGGLGSPPELAAAFVLPNDPSLDPLLARAARHLREATGDGALAGYQRPGRTRAMASAIWRACCDLELGYIEPPASFEANGQKVRFPGRIAEHRLGTCLDLTLLLAAALEQVGLHPLIVLTEGHAFCGVWEREECFPEPALEDGLRLWKRVELGEILVFETTLLTARPPADFELAVRTATRALERRDAFRGAIDVRAARRRRIRPLPVHGAGAAAGAPTAPSAPMSATAPVATREALDPPPPPPLPAAPPRAETSGSEARDESGPSTPPSPRIEAWKRRLLDLSLRNRFLNFRVTRRTLPLECPDVAALEDLLAAGKRFELRPKVDPLAAGRSARVHEERTGEVAREAFLREELQGGVLHTELAERELEGRLVELYRAARLSLEETGANTLYLALGFLYWTEAPSSTRELRAPILLLPMTLERRTSGQGFRLVLAEEEPWINVTLLEKLKSDFGLDVSGLDECPEDDAGLDVPAILRRWRQAVRDVDRWHVREEAVLGLFSFTKFLMWRDLERNSELLLAHRVVRYLVDRPSEPFDPEPFPDPRRLDAEVPPQEQFLPLDADSSQLAAIVAAAGQGKSFVLEGPPGTGKSQTITNLVAQCLATGQSVLFVAEKQAALSVVQRRLEAVGLGPFCLELHSSKASKRECLAQLERALGAARVAPPGGWEERARELFELRAGLDRVVEELHRARPLGRSVYEVTTRAIGLQGATPLELSIAGVEEIGGEALRAELLGLEALVSAASDVGSPASHPLRAVGRADWRLELPEQVARAARPVREALEMLSAALERAGRALGFFAEASEAPADATRRELCELAAAATHLVAAPYPAPSEALMSESGWRELELELLASVERAADVARRRTALEERWRAAAFDEDLDGLSARLERARASFWPLSWWRLRKVRAELAPLLVGAPPKDLDALRADLDELAALRREAASLADASPTAARLLEPTWRAGRGDADALRELIAWTGELRELALALGGVDPERGARLRRRWMALAREERDALDAGAPLGADLRALPAALSAFERAYGELADLLELDEARIHGGGAPALAATSELLAGLAASGSELRDWCRWRAARAQVAASLAAPAVAAIEAGTLAPADAPAAFERAFAELWLRRTSDASPALRAFHGGEQRRLIERFRRLDREWIALTRELLAARLAARVPQLGAGTAASSELGLLARELKKTRRHLPVRKLFEALPSLLPRLKPCVLMSPLSAAQFLDAGFERFDLVVFDEASQIPVWDAVGAIARGRSTLVVGDSKQLPPTTFFTRLEDEDSLDDDDFEELESLLDDCTASGLPQAYLGWHYRSRHESLITFSNAHYYDNRLLTFTSPVAESPDLGVALRLVEDAVYDRGKSATNRREAEALVAEAVALCKGFGDPGADGAQSLGIVTFSLAQQRLVETLLDAARAADPALERHFDGDNLEPVFVKNLENVQGDERDVILLGVGYGPDAAGRVSMNFGPLNRAGGERRLNVAITRARRRLVLFSSFRSEAIELARTQAVGVRHLKTFIDYAERGPRAISEAVALGAPGVFESPFERDVHDRLAALGWQLDPQIGCSGYRIDLGVRHPAAPGRYVLGIECDGATYHSAATARDRDRLRAGVLEGLGWSLERVWSTDWWLDPERETRRLDAAIRAALEADERRASARAAQGEAASSSANEDSGAVADASAGTDADGRAGVGADDDAVADLGAGAGARGSDSPERPSSSSALSADPERPSEVESDPQGDRIGERPAEPERYSVTVANEAAPALLEPPLASHVDPARPFRPYPGGAPLGDLEALRDPHGTRRLARALLEVVEHEGPVERQRAARLVAERYGVGRTTQQIAARVLETLSAIAAPRRPLERDGFLWPPSIDPVTWRAFRTPPTESEAVRTPEELSLEEIANAALHILSQNVRLPLADLARETARLFGRRLGKHVDSRMRAGIELLAQRGEATLQGDTVALP